MFKKRIKDRWCLTEKLQFTSEPQNWGLIRWMWARWREVTAPLFFLLCSLNCGRSFFFFLAVPLDMRDLPQLGIEPAPSAVEVQCLKHWAIRGVPDPLLSEKLFLVHSCGWNSHIAWSAKNAVTLFWWLSAFYLMIFFHTPCGNMSTGTATCWPPNSRAKLKIPVICAFVSRGGKPCEPAEFVSTPVKKQILSNR